MNDSTKNDNMQHFWHGKSGELPTSMTNDYLFRALCQENQQALQSIICAVLHWDREQILTTEVTNPILLGRAIDDKEYVLDINVTLNNSIALNLEMQVMNEGNWQDRSLVYLCRRFDGLHKGQDYKNANTAIHIGILNFDPFGKRSRLRESFRLISQHSNIIYSEKLQLFVLCLPHMEQAVQEDRYYHTDLWARFFNATTWEELKMLAKEDKVIESAVSTANKLWENEEIRARMQAREDYYYWEGVRQAREKEREEIIQKQEEDLQKNEELIQKQEEDLQKNEELIQKQEEDLQKNEELIQKQEKSLREQEKSLREQEKSLREQEKNLREQEKSLREQEKDISRLKEELAEERQSRERLEAELEELRCRLANQ